MNDVHFNKFTVFRYLAIILLIAGIMYATQGDGFVVIVPFVLFSFFKKRPETLVFWMMLITCMLVTNALIVPKSILFVLAQRSLLCLIGLFASLAIVGHRKSPIVKPLLGIFLYVLFMIIPSSYGWAPKISYLKILLFTLIFLAYFFIANQAATHSQSSQSNIRSAMLAFCIYFLIGSIFLIPFPALGQMRGEDALQPGMTSLFQGMTSHSQCLGPVVSALAVFLLSDMLFSLRRPNKLYLILLACCPILIFKTSSRTGMGAFLLGVMYTTYLFIKARGIATTWRRRVTNYAMFLFGFSLFAATCIPGINTRAAQFILKWSSEENQKISFEEVFKSRQGKYDQCMENFRKSPIIGNGFQVSDGMAEPANKSSGLIVSAAVEKGFWIAAILEEGGVIGLFLFSVFIVTALVKLSKRGAYMTSSSLFVALMTNFGEFTFFSMTYIGGFSWAIVFVSAAIDATRIHDEKKQLAPSHWQWRM